MPRILLSLLLVALMCCCVKNGSELVCNNPYIQVGNECCLDRNDNNICDKDEITAMTTSTTTATTTTATSTTTTAAPSTANTEPTVKEREVVLVIDTSGSMNESVVNTPQQAAALGIVNQLNDKKLMRKICRSSGKLCETGNG